MSDSRCEHEQSKMIFDPDINNYWCEACKHWLYDTPDVQIVPTGEWIPDHEKQAWVFVSNPTSEQLAEAEWFGAQIRTDRERAAAAAQEEQRE